MLSPAAVNSRGGPMKAVSIKEADRVNRSPSHTSFPQSAWVHVLPMAAFLRLSSLESTGASKISVGISTPSKRDLIIFGISCWR